MFPYDVHNDFPTFSYFVFVYFKLFFVILSFSYSLVREILVSELFTYINVFLSRVFLLIIK